MISTIVVPTYNESESLPVLIRKIFSLDHPFHMIVVDDNSPDGTGEIADRIAKENSRVKVIHRPSKLGLGSAYVQGFHLALSEGADYIFEMDADLSHDPVYLPQMLEELKTYDLVIGSRYLRGVRVNDWPFRRLLMSKLANLYVQFVVPLPIEDSTGGYRGYRRAVLEAIDLDRVRSDGYGFQIELTYLTHRKGFRITEIPIMFYERRGGYSKISRRIVWEALWLVLKLRLGLIR